MSCNRCLHYVIPEQQNHVTHKFSNSAYSNISLVSILYTHPVGFPFADQCHNTDYEDKVLWVMKRVKQQFWKQNMGIWISLDLALLSSCMSHCFITVLKSVQNVHTILWWSLPGSVCLFLILLPIFFFTMTYVFMLTKDDSVIHFSLAHNYICDFLKIRFSVNIFYSQRKFSFWEL